MLPLDDMLTVQKLIKDKASYGTMNVFGIIVYSEENPHIVKVLRDKDYWNSFNYRAKNWIVYAIKPNDNHIDSAYLLQDLGIVASEELPVLMIIAIGPDKSILQRGFPIDDKDEITAYHSIENQISVVTNAISKINPSCWSSTGVHREAIGALASDFTTEKWKKVSSRFASFLVKLGLSSLFNNVI